MCTARQHFRHGSYRNGAIRVKKKKKERKTLERFCWFVYPALNVSLVEEKGVEGVSPWRDEIAVVRLETFRQRVRPFYLFARVFRARASRRRPTREDGKDKREREMQEDATCVNTCTLESASIVVFVGSWRETRADGRETNFCQTHHPPRNINRVGWASRVLFLRVLRC